LSQRSARAWVVSLVGLVVLAAIGIGLGALLLKCFALLRPESAWQFVLVTTTVAVVTVLCVSVVMAGLD
jgi:hypothetical protein